MRRTILIFVVLLFLTACVSETASTPAAIQACDTLSPTITYTPSLSSTPTSTLTPVSMPTPTESTPPKPVAATQETAPVSVNAEDPYTLNISVDQEQIASASDEELLTLAPVFPESFDFTKLGFNQNEIENLNISGEVVRVGENKLVPYQDQEEETVMAWDVEKGEMVHFYKSVYSDEQTGMTINSYVYTDNQWARDNNTWWELNELNEGDTSKAFFDFTLPLNYMYEYHLEEFKDGLKMNPYDDIDWINVKFNEWLTWQEIDALHKRAVQIFDEEISGRIESGEETKIDIGRTGDLMLTDKNIDVLFKYNYSSNYSKRGWAKPPFGDYGNIKAKSGETNSLVVDINMDRPYKNGYLSHSVGGLLQHALLGITAGGYSLSLHSETTSNGYKSFGDLMIYQTCGEEVINRYLLKVGGKFLENRSVPQNDWINDYPVCLTNERHPSN